MRRGGNRRALIDLSGRSFRAESAYYPMFTFLDFVDRVKRKLLRPWRRRAYAEKTEPFLFRGAKGLHFRLYPGEYIDSDIFSEGAYELYFLRWIERTISGRTYVDIGANIGNHALYLAGNFDSVHCFEPNPPVADRLAENAALNAIPIRVHRVGLGKIDTVLPFHPNNVGNLGGSSFAANGFDATCVLPVRNGDAYFAAHAIEDIDLLKIDVEGFELEVLSGLQAIIQRDRPVVILEFDGRKLDPAKLQELLPNYVLAELNEIGALVDFVPERRYYGAIVARSVNQGMRGVPASSLESLAARRVQALIAGGDRALRHAVEGAEDDFHGGGFELEERGATLGDVVVGISASGTTPYVLGAIDAATRLGARTVAITCDPGSPLAESVEIAITPQVGPEVVTGSTRMKGGLAQKMILAALSTAVMVRMGRVRGNHMTHVAPVSSKLERRAIAMLVHALRRSSVEVAVAKVFGDLAYTGLPGGRMGDVLLTGTVYDALSEARRVGLIDRGLARLRNVTDPVRIYACPPSNLGAPLVTDPVCRMQLDPHSCAGSLDYAGQTFRFCSLACAELFAAHPERYVGDRLESRQPGA